MDDQRGDLEAGKAAQPGKGSDSSPAPESGSSGSQKRDGDARRIGKSVDLDNLRLSDLADMVGSDITVSDDDDGDAPLGGDVDKISATVSPRRYESFQLEIQKAEHQRRGRFTTALLVIFGLTVLVGFALIFAAMCLHLDTAPLRELMAGIVPAELALLGGAITFHYYDPKR